MEKKIDKIEDDEQVARILFSPSHIYAGRVSPKAFKLENLRGGPENYISVLRDDVSKLAEVTKKFRPRHEGDTKYGYTLLSASQVRTLDDEIAERHVTLEPKPSKNLPWHAGIFLYLNDRIQTADDVSPDIDYFQKELSLLCDGPHPFNE